MVAEGRRLQEGRWWRALCDNAISCVDYLLPWWRRCYLLGHIYLVYHFGPDWNISETEWNYQMDCHEMFMDPIDKSHWLTQCQQQVKMFTLIKRVITVHTASLVKLSSISKWNCTFMFCHSLPLVCYLSLIYQNTFLWIIVYILPQWSYNEHSSNPFIYITTTLLADTGPTSEQDLMIYYIN